MSQERRIAWIGLAGGLLLVLGPVLLSPLLTTQDGPSHLYNAFLAHRLGAGEAAFAPYLELGPGLWPNRLTHYLLTGLGPWLGWATAERVVAALAAGLPFVALAGWLRERNGRIALSVLAAGLWMVGSWFFWKGFYDFCISLAPFLGAAAVAARVEEDSGWLTHLALQAMLALALLAHLFTFTAALAMVGFVLAGKAWRRELPPVHLAAVLPGTVALAAVLSGGATGGGEMVWYPWGEAVEGLWDAGWAAAILESDRWAGRAVMAALVAAPFLRRFTDAGGGDRLTLFEIFALLALAGSMAIPARVGTGQYAPERLRLLSLLLLTPSAGALAVGLRGRPRRSWIAPAAAVALAAAFLFRGLETAGRAGAVEADLRSMDRVLERYGATAGDWITATHWNPFGPFYRVGAYVHLHDRLAVERELVLLDNYEARMPIFPVRWREMPHRPEFRRAQAGETLAWLAEVIEGERPWSGPLLVIHEGRLPVISRSERMATGATLREPGYAVTELLWIPRR